jgi:hypothetical protein
MAVRRVVFPGTSIDVEGCKVYIFNIVKTTNLKNEPRWLISCRAEYNGRLSHQFFLDVGSNEEFMRKLKTELALFKVIVLAGRYDKYIG